MSLNKTTKQYIDAQKEYIIFLEKIISQHIGFRTAHNQFDSLKDIQQGYELREKIKILEEQLE